MQNVVTQLQEIIKRHYGLSSELILKPLSSYQSINKELYSSVDRTLSIPLHEPGTQRLVGYFKIMDLASNDQILIDRLNDLVQVTLQSYINLIDQMSVTDDLMQYMQMELHPQKIIRLQDKEAFNKKIVTGAINLKPKAPEEPLKHTELLLFSKSRRLLDNLAVHIHDTAQNQFFIRLDHMPETFLTRINDLIGLEQTTLYIPRAYQLTPVQQKTLETYLLLEKNRSKSLLIVAGTRLTVPLLIKEGVSESLLTHFHMFHLLSEGDATNNIAFESLSQCAAAVLGMKTDGESTLFKNQLNLTKSYNLIPSLQTFFPTIH